MKKKVAKIVLIALFAAVSFISYEFDLSWADTGTETEQNIIENAADNVEKEMEFLFIESIELESPGTQNIAVAWDKDMSNITEFTLVYSDSNGKTYTLRESNRTEKSVLFTKEFSSSETGSYKIMGMKYLIEDIEEEQYLDFKDIEVKAEFSIVDEQDDKAAEALEENVATTSTDTERTTTEVTALLSTANTRAAARNGGNVVVVIDPGHGGSDPGACRNGLREKDLTLKISKYLRDELKEYSGVDVYMTRDTDKALETSPNTELENRVNYAASRNADVLVSIHINAGGGKGAEVWTPNENYNSEIYKEGQKISQDILNELVALGLTNRGVKESYSKDNTTYPDGSLADYYGIIRRSKLAGFTGIIVEHAFIDNASDAAFLKSESNLKKLGVADATGIAEYFGLQKGKWVTTTEGKKYQYADGSYAKGYIKIEGKYYYFDKEGIMQKYHQMINGEPYYFFSDGVAMAEGWYDISKGRIYGIGNGKLATGSRVIEGKKYTFDKEGILINIEENGYPIQGKSIASVEKMVRYYYSSGKKFPSDIYSLKGAKNIEVFCSIYYEEASSENIRAEVAFCQAMKETGWLQYGGDVKAEQCNFAGIGATGGGNVGASFPDVRTGVRAQIQHLKAYANNEALVNQCVDPRFNLVKRGSAPYVEWLGKNANPNGVGWAPSADYGKSIVNMINTLLSM